ncbi:MAG: DUF507 family protein [bacterium]
MLSEDEIQGLSREIAGVLSEDKDVEFLGSDKEVEEKISSVLAQNMQEEMKLNADSDKIMDQYAREIDRGDMDPHKMFSMIKRKLAKERGVIL